MVIVLLLVVVSVLVAANWYLWRRLFRDTTRGPGVPRRAGAVLIGGGWVVAIGALMAERAGAPFWLQQTLAWPGLLWLALSVYLLLGVVAGEVVRPVLRRVLERRDARTRVPAAAGVPRPEPIPAGAPPRETVPAGASVESAATGPSSEADSTVASNEAVSTVASGGAAATEAPGRPVPPGNGSPHPGPPPPAACSSPGSSRAPPPRRPSAPWAPARTASSTVPASGA
ncbi:hypothetical protein GCM10020295_31090 [Streptomyces cinereospinus]